MSVKTSWLSTVAFWINIASRPREKTKCRENFLQKVPVNFTGPLSCEQFMFQWFFTALLRYQNCDIKQYLENHKNKFNKDAK